MEQMRRWGFIGWLSSAPVIVAVALGSCTTLFFVWPIIRRGRHRLLLRALVVLLALLAGVCYATLMLGAVLMSLRVGPG